MTDEAMSLKDLDDKLFAKANAQLNSKEYRDLDAPGKALYARDRAFQRRSQLWGPFGAGPAN